ncbi:hypothetical protein AMJ47_00210 [Parcubacteria bacterium DG_72]|nr:MAG: hypothetical protein AMJ47_00210 [Parcubacteria bacterium DG_72]
MIMITKHRKIYFLFSITLIIACIVFLFVFGLKPGIDFTGGSIMEIEYKQERPSAEEIRNQLSQFDLGQVYVQPTGEKGVIIRMKNISEELHQEILSVLSQEQGLGEEKRFESIGPVIGKELREKTNIVVASVLLSMIIYIAIAFRKVKRPLKSWQYGIASVIALFHDILIPVGIFVVLGKLYNVEITIPVVTALLAVLGYSINNTVVVFDRIRENLLKRGEDFEQTVNISIKQTLSRQINTSLTTLFVASAIFFFGGATLQYFSLALILGIIAGTYSSIFLAGNLLVAWYKFRNK